MKRLSTMFSHAQFHNRTLYMPKGTILHRKLVIVRRHSKERFHRGLERLKWTRATRNASPLNIMNVEKTLDCLTSTLDVH
jgi:hypothetical protein